MQKKRARYTPMEIAKQIDVRISKFNELVSEGVLPKGRLGEDGRRYYTEQDLRFIQREWKNKTTVHFLFYTLPLVLVVVFLLLLTFREIGQTIEEYRTGVEPTQPSGFALQPQFPTGDEVSGTVIPSLSPLPSTPEEPSSSYADSQIWKEFTKDHTSDRKEKKRNRNPVQ